MSGFSVSVWTGASTAPELDGLLAAADGIDLRMPYQSDPVTRAKINAGTVDYLDLHLSHVAQAVWEGFYGHLDIALVEVAGISEEGHLIPSSSVGNNTTWLDPADRVILEANSWQPLELEGMHDVYYGTALPPNRKPIQILKPAARIGVPNLECDPEKIVAVVPTHGPDRNSPFKAPDGDSTTIAQNVLEFLDHEVKRGHLPRTLLPLQSGVGNIANAVLLGLDDGPFRPLSAYTEVIQDGMLQLLRSGTLEVASATAFSLSEGGLQDLRAKIDDYRKRIVLRPQEISNHPDVIRRLGCLTMNGMIEADIYGNANSTHVMGTKIQNGIGGSSDFIRNAYISMFVVPSVANGGAISCIVPMASHVDHTEHDVNILITEQGVADLRGLAPRKRAQQITTAAPPDYRDALQHYFDRARASSPGKHPRTDSRRPCPGTPGTCAREQYESNDGARPGRTLSTGLHSEHAIEGSPIARPAPGTRRLAGRSVPLRNRAERLSTMRKSAIALTRRPLRNDSTGAPRDGGLPLFHLEPEAHPTRSVQGRHQTVR